MENNKDDYPVRFDVKYPGKLDRLSSFFRLFWGVPILIVLIVLSSPSFTLIKESGSTATYAGGDIGAGLFLATLLMILFRQRYPRWWFDFMLEMNRFSARVGAYMLLLTDRYPSTVDKQSVVLDLEYPDVEQDLNRWLPLVKWLLAIPHYIVLVFLSAAVIVASVIAWFAILFTGQYPRSLFDFVVGVGRWWTRVGAYAFYLTTDKYPPFSLS